jgi:hypothetical protein
MPLLGSHASHLHEIGARNAGLRRAARMSAGKRMRGARRSKKGGRFSRFAESPLGAGLVMGTGYTGGERIIAGLGRLKRAGLHAFMRGPRKTVARSLAGTIRNAVKPKRGLRLRARARMLYHAMGYRIPKVAQLAKEEL